jgi:hypothetical protein
LNDLTYTYLISGGYSYELGTSQLILWVFANALSVASEGIHCYTVVIVGGALEGIRQEALSENLRGGTYGNGKTF